MNNKTKQTLRLAFILTIALTFYFAPLGGYTGLSVVLEGNFFAIIGFLAITAGVIAQAILTIKAWLQ